IVSPDVNMRDLPVREEQGPLCSRVPSIPGRPKSDLARGTTWLASSIQTAFVDTPPVKIGSAAWPCPMSRTALRRRRGATLPGLPGSSEGGEGGRGVWMSVVRELLVSDPDGRSWGRPSRTLRWWAALVHTASSLAPQQADVANDPKPADTRVTAGIVQCDRDALLMAARAQNTDGVRSGQPWPRDLAVGL